MSVYIPSSLSQADRELISSTYESTDALLQAIETNTLAGGISVGDALMYAAENDTTDFMAMLDPDNGSLSYIWDNEDAMSALESLHRMNQTNAEFESLVEDCRLFLEAGGIEPSIIHDTQSVIEDYTSKYGPPMVGGSTTSETDTEMQNLMEIMKVVNPFLYMLFDIQNNLMPKMTEVMNNILDEQLPEAGERMEEYLDDMESLDGENQDDQMEAQVIQQKISMEKEYMNAIQETLKAMNEIVESALETASAGLQRTNRATSAIIGNIGS